MSKPSKGILNRFSKSPKLIIFDLDGTLYDSQMIRDDTEEHLYEDVKKISFLPGVKEFLTGFGGKKILVTKEKFPKFQEEKIKILGLDKLFDAIFICPYEEDKKAYFQKIIQLHKDLEIYVVGDRLDLEIKDGNELGLTTIWFKRGKYKDYSPVHKLEMPTYTIIDFGQLWEIIQPLKAVILAAGKGSRFSSEKTKVLHEIAGKPLVRHVVDLADSLGIKEKIVVIGYQGEEVKKELWNCKGIKFAWQKEQKGTGHAVMMARDYLKDFEGEVLILYADVPGVSKETLQQLIAQHRKKDCILTILTAVLKEPVWHGRIIKEGEKVMAIREFKDATPKELEIKEVNSGIMIINNDFLLSALDKLTTHNAKGEYYLTDIVEIAYKLGKKICTFSAYSEMEIYGVNYVEELEELRKFFHKYSGK